MTAPNVNEKKFDNRNKKGYLKRKHNPMNDQLSNKLTELFKLSKNNEVKNQERRQQASSRGLRPLLQDSVDGEDHINFFTNVKTELGGLLSTECRLPFKFGSIDKDGNIDGEVFESLKCLWAYYRTGCLYDGFANAPDYKIRKLYRTINEYPKQESIFAVMVLGYYCMMLTYPALAEAVVANKLPFDYYSERDGVKKRTAVSKLMINAIYEVRRAVKFNTRPRLESFLSQEDQTLAMNILPEYRYDYIVNILLSRNNFINRYYSELESWSPEQVSKLKIDLGQPVQNASMDAAAAQLAIPLTVEESVEETQSTVDMAETVTNTETVAITDNSSMDVELEIQNVSQDVVLDNVAIEQETIIVDHHPV